MDNGDDALLDLVLLVASRVGMEQTMHGIADFATLAIPGADGAAVVLLKNGHPTSAAASAPVVRTVELLQYDMGEGPSITASGQRLAMTSPSLGADLRWPRFGSRVGRMGFQSVVVVPLQLPDLVVGTMSAYARTKGAFGALAVHTAERFAAPAAAITRNAFLLERSKVEIAQLQEALQVRPLIDQAVGIIRSRTGKSAAEALATLRKASNAEHARVFAVARRLVDDSVDRAKSRGRSNEPYDVL
ncbi:MAG: GAF and ANTAR domain-containing protein [Actinomycetota bacterium]|nr:GAF and ANTAR domain-containing protein [Actinomycetota bacterium]